jgi:hypothetical protein
MQEHKLSADCVKANEQFQKQLKKANASPALMARWVANCWWIPQGPKAPKQARLTVTFILQHTTEIVLMWP